ncbi:MAG: Gfo/Idh/MocA family oxidoreductase [Patescibacteria group bacterium]|nr:Gfo/Idh/MocA family oxidoreductase [Patescibacteria group bacterium]
MARLKPIRTAVVGCGRIGAFTVKQPGDGLTASYFPHNHCAAIRATPGLALVAVCDTDAKAARRAARLHHVRNVYADFRKMILEQKPDILSIATRTAGRADLIAFAAQHGVKGMHIEKPLATNLRETRKALDAIRKHSVAISYGTVRRYMPVYRQAKAMLDSGRFGRLERIEIEFGKSNLLWTHPHSVDLMSYFSGNKPIDYILSRFAFSRNDVRKNIVDCDPLLDYGHIRFKDGSGASILPHDGQNIRALCTNGEVAVYNNGESIMTRSKKSPLRKIRKKKGVSGRVQSFIELRDAIIKKEAPSLTPAELLREQKMLLALGYSGAHGRRKTKLSEINDAFTVTGKFNGLYP